MQQLKRNVCDSMNLVVLDWRMLSLNFPQLSRATHVGTGMETRMYCVSKNSGFAFFVRISGNGDPDELCLKDTRICFLFFNA